MSDLQSQLAEMVGDVDGAALGIHARAGRLIFVDAGLDLVEVGTAMANDDKVRFSRWLDEKLIFKLAEPELKSNQYRVLIVQPFVLAQAVD